MQTFFGNKSTQTNIPALLHLIETSSTPLLALNSHSEIIAANTSAHKDPVLKKLQHTTKGDLFALACSIPKHIKQFAYQSSEIIPPISGWTLFSHFDQGNTMQLYRVSVCTIDADSYWLLSTEDNRGLNDISQLYKSLIDSSSDAIICKTLDGRVISWNKGAQTIFGYSAEQMIGQPILRLFPKSKVYEEAIFLKKIARGEKIEHFRSVRRNMKGENVHVSVCLSPILSSSGAVIGVSKVARDITREVISARQANNYQSIIATAEDAIISLSIKGIVLQWNAAAEELMGYPAEQVVNHPISHFLSPDSHQQITDCINTLLAKKVLKHKKLQLVTNTGTTLNISSSFSLIVSEDGEIDGVALILRDINDELKRDQEIAYLANNDALTGCYNRSGFARALTNQKIMQDHISGALIFIDLDNFKPINDSFGHDVGDQLLVAIVQALKSELRHTDVISRFGGDEFLIFLSNIQGKEHITDKAQSLLHAISRITHVNDIAINISASLGISQYPVDGDNYSTLLKKADHAMYQAKARGKNQLQFFMSTPEQTNLAQAVLARELRQALEADELQVVLQPIVNSDNLSFRKAEILLRWHHKEHGWIPPEQMISIAEQYGFVSEIGLWVMDKACKILIDMAGTATPDFQLFLNKSALEFYDEKNIAQHIATMRKYGLQGHHFVFELTETTMMSHTAVIEKVLKQLLEVGVKIAIDDFGTGYSSLAYLKKFPANFLKIDKSFVQSIAPGTTDYFLCETIIDIARKLGIEVISEGVETEAQAYLLNQMGCIFSQGYWFSRPINAEQFRILCQKLEVANAAGLITNTTETFQPC